MANKLIQLQSADGLDNLFPNIIGGAKLELLWTNPSTATTFAAQTVSLDLSNYDLIYIEYWRYQTTDSYNVYSLTKKDFEIEVLAVYAGKTCMRSAKATSTGVIFGGGYIYNTYGSSTVDNQYINPKKIYGIKMTYSIPTEVQGIQYIEV